MTNSTFPPIPSQVQGEPLSAEEGIEVGDTSTPGHTWDEPAAADDGPEPVDVDLDAAAEAGEPDMVMEDDAMEGNMVDMLALMDTLHTLGGGRREGESVCCRCRPQ